MREERIEIAGVPAKVYEPPGATGLLLLGHGGGASKDVPRFVELARRYAGETGLAVVCIDAVDHGERRPPNVTADLPARWHSSTAPRMTADWETVAAGLARIGPPLAYVGFSMGAIFGVCTAAAMPGLRAVVLVVGGIPSGWVDDPPLRNLLVDAARRISEPSVLMLNKSDDELFAVPEVHDLFDAIATPRRQLHFTPGPHDDWPAEAITASIELITRGRISGSPGS